jgi:hypothetical protein
MSDIKKSSRRNAAPGAAEGGLRDIYMQPAFLVCAAVLAVAAATMSVAIKSFGVYLKKMPLALKKPLDSLDEEALYPYRVVGREKILDKDMVEALGTTDYIQWTLEDRRAEAESGVRMCSLFITYYELPDRVPHVPEECYTGTGHQKLASDAFTVEIPAAGSGRPAGPRTIPARYLVFAAAGSHWSSEKFTVAYLFNVNGGYANSREEARAALNRNIFGKYSYFSKVEWKFYGLKYGRPFHPAKDEVIAASRGLLAAVLPELEAGHWPDWPVPDE